MLKTEEHLFDVAPYDERGVQGVLGEQAQRLVSGCVEIERAVDNQTAQVADLAE